MLAFDKAMPGPGGMDLGVELSGDMGPKLRLAEVGVVDSCRAEGPDEMSCGRGSVWSGVTALMVA